MAQNNITPDTGGKPRTAIKRETMEIGEAQKELREVLSRIELFTLTESNWEDWDVLWDKKRRLKAILNQHNH